MNDENILVSVIIPTYNRSKVIHKAIDSVLRQTYKNWELIIIDDGSTDDTQIIMGPYLKHQNIKYCYKNNGGSSSARNLGILNAKGKYIAFLDSDDEFEKKKLEVQLSEMIRFNSSCSICNGAVIIGKKSKTFLKYNQSFMFDKIFFSNNKIPICASFIMIKNNLQINFNEKLQVGEDIDFVMKFLINDEILFIKEPLVIRNKGLDSIRLSVNTKAIIASATEGINIYRGNEYNLSEEINLMRISELYIGLGFWYFFDNQIEQGRSSINSGLMLNRNIKKKIKYRTLCYISFIPGTIRIMRKAALFLWKQNFIKT